MPRVGTTRTFTISLPTKMANEVERLAKKESRTKSELFREAFRAYRAERVRTILDELNAKANARGGKAYTQDEIERFVDEDRTEQWAARRAAKE